MPLAFGVPIRGFVLSSHHGEGPRVEGEELHPAAGVAVDGVNRNLAASGVRQTVLNCKASMMTLCCTCCAACKGFCFLSSVIFCAP